jgi:hypothetical protein
MQLFLVTTAIFALAMLGIAVGMLAGRQKHECGCKAAARVMKQQENAACASCPVGNEQQLVEIGPLAEDNPSENDP